MINSWKQKQGVEWDKHAVCLETTGTYFFRKLFHFCNKYRTVSGKTYFYRHHGNKNNVYDTNVSRVFAGVMWLNVSYWKWFHIAGILLGTVDAIEQLFGRLLAWQLDLSTAHSFDSHRMFRYKSKWRNASHKVTPRERVLFRKQRSTESICIHK